MPFRDELEAARARIEKLDRALAAASAPKEGEPPFAIATVVLSLLVVALTAGSALLWNQLQDAEEATASWREMEGRTGHQLEETLARLDEARRAREPGPGWTSEAATRGREWARGGLDASEAWTGRVTERIGEAPVAVGQTCALEIARTNETAHHGGAFQCHARVRCEGSDVYPREGESDQLGCTFGPGGHMQPIGAAEPGSLRLTGTFGDLRIDDGPIGTWSLRIVEGAR